MAKTVPRTALRNNALALQERHNHVKRPIAHRRGAPLAVVGTGSVVTTCVLTAIIEVDPPQVTAARWAAEAAPGGPRSRVGDPVAGAARS
jgi:hypothetical protein